MGAKKKDPNAVALGSKGGKARAASRSASELSKIGKKGAQARYDGLSKAERSELARKAVMSRWGKTARKGER